MKRTEFKLFVDIGALAYGDPENGYGLKKQ